jgi:four helix bundle protein
MTNEELKFRTKQFAVRVIKLTASLQQNKTCDIIAKQIIRSATSVGANYRAACRARSQADFISKITIVEEEADETLYWLELLVESEMIDKVKIESFMKEANELTAIFTASGKTAKQNKNQ